MPRANDSPGRRQAALTRLEQLASEQLDLCGLLRGAAAIVAEALAVDFCKILELLPDAGNLLVRAGVGWREGVVGETLIPATSQTDAGHTLLTGAPVIVEDLLAENRFPAPSLLHDHGVTSGVSLPIPGAEPFGVLGVHTSGRRSFSAHEVRFLEAVAGILARAIHRHRAHEALRQSEERFRRIFEDSPIGMTIAGIDAPFLRANRVVCDILGYSEEELKHLTFDQIAHPDDLAKTLESTGKLFRGEDPHSGLVKRLLTKSGEAVWVKLTATLIRDDRGNLLHQVGMIEDLTEQYRRDRDLRLARFTLERALEAIFWAGPDGRFSEVNAGATELSGYAREKLLSISVWDLDENLSAESWPETWMSLRKRGSMVRETRFRAGNGLSLPVELSVAYLEFSGTEYLCWFVRDISRRKQAEEDLRASESRYRDLFENAAATVVTTDLDENITAVNRTGERVLGYPREELLGKNLAELLPPDQRDMVRGMTAKKLRESGTAAYEVEMLAKDGGRLPMQMTLSLVQEDGKPAGCHGIAIDVSEQRKALEAVRRSEERFRALVEDAMSLTTVLDAGGTVLYLSPSSERVLGYKPEERLGKSMFDIIHPDDASAVREVIARGSKTPGAFATLECRVRHKDGSWRYLEAGARNLLDSPVVAGIVVNSLDITERKRSEQWFRASFQHAPIGKATASLDGRFLQVNPALCGFLGYSEEALLDLRWQDVTLSDDLHASDEAVRQLLAGVVPSFRMEKRYVHKSGFPLWAYVGVSLLRDTENRPENFSVQIVDINQQKAAEEALRRSQRELRALAGRLLHTAEEAHRTLARELHDDLGQRLTALGFDLAALEKARPANFPERLRKKLHAALTRCAGLSDDLRRVAHQLHPSSIELLGLPAALRELCQDASNQVRFPVRATAGQLPESIPPDIALCLYRVAQECLRNIAKHAHGDKVSVTLSGVGQGLRLSIKDNGVGFDATTTLPKGGLGLISIRERVRLAGGTLSIKSQPGQGTHVIVDVPVPGSPMLERQDEHSGAGASRKARSHRPLSSVPRRGRAAQSYRRQPGGKRL
jgi:PAS domain S-box-containing protein